VRETLVIHSRLSWRQVRGVAAIERQHGLQALAIEQFAARLAGGFLQPINSDSLKAALGEAITLNRGPTGPSNGASNGGVMWLV
jgi:hypothetical protein